MHVRIFWQNSRQALFTSINGIERAIDVCCFGYVSTNENKIFVKGGFSKNSLLIAVVMCKATIQTQEDFCQFWLGFSLVHINLCNDLL